jgi:uncharacterized membrane protein YtjA (UPF0391 family)
MAVRRMAHAVISAMTVLGPVLGMTGLASSDAGAAALVFRDFIAISKLCQNLLEFHHRHARFRVWLLRVGTQGVWSCSFAKGCGMARHTPCPMFLPLLKVRAKDTSRWRLPVLRPGLGAHHQRAYRLRADRHRRPPRITRFATRVPARTMGQVCARFEGGG